MPPQRIPKSPDSFSFSDDTLPVRGILYTRKARSQKILSASDGGHLWQLSVGVDFEIERIPAGRQVRVNGKDFTGPLIVARHGYLTDLSFVAVGGDDTTWATIAARRRLGALECGGLIPPSICHRNASFAGSEKGIGPGPVVRGLSTTSADQLEYCTLSDPNRQRGTGHGHQIDSVRQPHSDPRQRV